jgi:hypothetical protein
VKFSLSRSSSLSNVGSHFLSRCLMPTDADGLSCWSVFGGFPSISVSSAATCSPSPSAAASATLMSARAPSHLVRSALLSDLLQHAYTAHIATLSVASVSASVTATAPLSATDSIDADAASDQGAFNDNQPQPQPHQRSRRRPPPINDRMVRVCTHVLRLMHKLVKRTPAHAQLLVRFKAHVVWNLHLPI